MKKRILTGFLSISLIFGVLASLAYKPDYFEISKQLEIFTTAFKEVTLYYVDETEPGELMKEALEPMLSSLDPYTNYIPEEAVEDFRIQNTGNYGGIGASIRKHKGDIIITGPYEGFAAEKVDLRAGDIIKAVNEESVQGKSSGEVSEILKGSPGSAVNLTISRQGQEITKKITREKVHISSVPYSDVFDQHYGYINLSSFTSSASKEVGEALKELQAKHDLKGVVLDLRGNPGGLLSEAVNVSNIFIEKGLKVVETKGKLKEWEETYATLNQPLDKEIPVVVLINGRSASASEIVAGTIQDYDRGVVVGRRSFGKGLVQQTRKLPYGSQIKVTIAKYYVPSGRCIQAINYAERNEDGSVKRIPDSLRVTYKTANGRVVKGGGGIDPDVEVKKEDLGKITAELFRNMHIFDFATQYVMQHDSIAAPMQFALSDAEYQNFKNWLADRDYHYVTATEKAIEELKEKSENEQYLKLIEAEVNQLEKAYTTHRNNDLEIHKKQIKELLEQEIASRYYFRKGRVANELTHDEEFKKALEILKNKKQYQNILAGA